MLHHWAKEWRGPWSQPPPVSQAKKNLQIAWEKEAVPKHLYLFISVPWRFDCSLALRNFKISSHSWTPGKSETQTLCKYWSFESTKWCPVAWSTEPSGKGGGCCFGSGKAHLLRNLWTCLDLPELAWRSRAGISESARSTHEWPVCSGPKRSSQRKWRIRMKKQKIRGLKSVNRTEGAGWVGMIMLVSWAAVYWVAALDKTQGRTSHIHSHN